MWRKSSYCTNGRCVEVDLGWRKSSFCEGGACVEVNLDYKKSSFCGSNACVEVAQVNNGFIQVKDSKVLGGPVLLFTKEEWVAFTKGVKNGEFDLED